MINLGMHGNKGDGPYVLLSVLVKLYVFGSESMSSVPSRFGLAITGYHPSFLTLFHPSRLCLVEQLVVGTMHGDVMCSAVSPVSSSSLPMSGFNVQHSTFNGLYLRFGIHMRR